MSGTGKCPGHRHEIRIPQRIGAWTVLTKLQGCCHLRENTVTQLQEPSTPSIEAALATPSRPGTIATRDDAVKRYFDVRHLTETLCRPLAVEDYMVQSMPDASPVKWHLAHTSWFFETFLLTTNMSSYRAFHPQYNYLFNSYYNALGQRIPRPHRGLLSRPTVEEVYQYRRHVDTHMEDFLHRVEESVRQRLAPAFVLGLNHEQQHQELILTDIKHAFGCNPLHPTYRERPLENVASAPPMRWLGYPGRLSSTGHDGDGFAFDNEGPRHETYVGSFSLASRLVTNGEYLAFMGDGGYDRPEFWLADGWDTRRSLAWIAPQYWEPQGDQWRVMTLAGFQELSEAEPVCHISYYEADAFARWAGARLPTEAEWEVAACLCPVGGNMLATDRLHPAPASSTDSVLPTQMYGDAWEWTQSPYVPYPGYRPTPGVFAEYNGKFMCNQLVLRGGSCVTPPGHIRPTYRNFFPPTARWQFTGIRLARDV